MPWFTALLDPARPSHWSGRDLLQRSILACALDWGYTPSASVPESDYSEDDITILLETNAYPAVKPRGWVFFYNLEPLWMPARLSKFLSGQYQTMLIVGEMLNKGMIDGALDYGEASTRIMLQHGIKTALCPAGYHEAIEVDQKVEPFEKGVWSLGKGRAIERRTPWVDRCNGRCLYTRKEPATRERLLRTEGVHLNIHRKADIQHFGSMKLIQMYLTNGLFVLSEPHWWSPLNSGEHYVETKLGSFPQQASYYMRHDKERKQIAAVGQKYVRHALRMEDWLKEALVFLGVPPW